MNQKRPRNCRLLYTPRISKAQARANARLIAAAPDLLEALVALRGACMAKHPSLLDQADKAIAKAKGEE